jgi:uncharacterized protein YbjT (DUF2867 family)
MRIALIGASGLVGGEIVRRLPAATLTLVSRRPTGQVAREIVLPVERWAEALAAEPVEIAISALGTTIAKAGSREAFDRIDRRAVVDFACAAKAAGARQMIVISSVGADPVSRSFYLATKGRMEQEIGLLGFDQFDIVRPGLLRGKRAEHRLGESIAIRLSALTDRLTPARLAAYRSIAVTDVAAATVALSGASSPGRFIHQGTALLELASH